MATPITYIYSAVMSGTLNGTPFTDQLVTITVFSDTSNIQEGVPFSGVYSTINPVTGTLDINTFPIATLTDPNLTVYSNTDLGESDGGLTITFNEFLNLDNPAWNAQLYDLSTNFGPISGPEDPFIPSFNMMTSAGIFSIDTSTGVTGPATFQAILTPIVCIHEEMMIETRDKGMQMLKNVIR